MARSFTLSCWLLVGISAVLIALKHCLPAAAVEVLTWPGRGGVRGGPNRGEEPMSKLEMLKMMSSVVYAQKSDTHKWVTSKLKKETADLKDQIALLRAQNDNMMGMIAQLLDTVGRGGKHSKQQTPEQPPPRELESVHHAAAAPRRRAEWSGDAWTGDGPPPSAIVNASVWLKDERGEIAFGPMAETKLWKDASTGDLRTNAGVRAAGEVKSDAGFCIGEDDCVTEWPTGVSVATIDELRARIEEQAAAIARLEAALKELQERM